MKSGTRQQVKLLITISKQTEKKQRGVVLLVMLIVLAFSFTAYYFSSISIIEVKADKIQNTRLELKRAKQALIGYALSHWRTTEGAGKIGKLPCPDHNTASADGVQSPNCGTAYGNGIGFLPWRTLEIGLPVDSSGSCLLYAVSPAYKTAPEAALNPESYGQLRTVDFMGGSLQGAEPEDRLVAVIIAPESELSGQTRLKESSVKCGSYYSNDIGDLVTAFLDDDGNTNNADIASSVDDGIDEFVSKYNESEALGSVLNDRLITISYSEIWSRLLITLETENFFDIKMRTLTKALAMCLAEYANYNYVTEAKRSLPWPAVLDLNDNEYRNSYSYDDNDDDTKGHAGRLPYQVRNSNEDIGNNLTQPPTPYAGFMEYEICKDLNVDGTGTNNINLTDKAGEYWNLWSNWKEYFFYALSKSYNPDNTGEDDCAAGCVKINGERAGIVFFSGLVDEDLAQQRYGPPLDGGKAVDGNDKDEVSNYLENGNTINFPDDSGVLAADDGNGAFNAVVAPSNDIMFCINEDLTVDACI